MEIDHPYRDLMLAWHEINADDSQVEFNRLLKDIVAPRSCYRKILEYQMDKVKPDSTMAHINTVRYNQDTSLSDDDLFWKADRRIEDNIETAKKKTNISYQSFLMSRQVVDIRSKATSLCKYVLDHADIPSGRNIKDAYRLKSQIEELGSNWSEFSNNYLSIWFEYGFDPQLAMDLSRQKIAEVEEFIKKENLTSSKDVYFNLPTVNPDWIGSQKLRPDIVGEDNMSVMFRCHQNGIQSIQFIEMLKHSKFAWKSEDYELDSVQKELIGSKKFEDFAAVIPIVLLSYLADPKDIECFSTSNHRLYVQDIDLRSGKFSIILHEHEYGAELEYTTNLVANPHKSPEEIKSAAFNLTQKYFELASIFPRKIKS